MFETSSAPHGHNGGPQGVLGVPVDPCITKMVTQGTKMESRGLPNTSLAYKSDPFQQATSQQLPPDRGPAAGEKPSNLPPPFRVQGVTGQ